MAKIALEDKEKEAIAWGLAQIGDYADRTPTEQDDPLWIIHSEGFKNAAGITDTCENLFAMVCTNELVGPFSPLERLILRLCIENTSWLNTYRLNGPTPLHGKYAAATLRELARKFEDIDIYVNILPE
jgi:hypothetical protein